MVPANQEEQNNSTALINMQHSEKYQDDVAVGHGSVKRVYFENTELLFMNLMQGLENHSTQSTDLAVATVLTFRLG